MAEVNENHWETVQAKTFIKWINDKLTKGGYRIITDIYEDLKSGVNLGNLLRVIMDEAVQYNTSPFTRIQKIENVEILLGQIKRRGITLVNIGSEDIVDGNRKLILGLVWTLILKLSIADIGMGDLSVKDEILRWCQEVTKPYNNVNITDLGRSWQDGLGFNAIIHRFRPELIGDYYNLKSCERYKNFENAFSIAEKHLDIPRLLDVEDIADVIRPDEKSMITYLSQYYKVFNQYEKERYSSQLVNNVLGKIDWSIQNRNLYEINARNFLKSKKVYDEKLIEVKDLFKSICNKIEDLSELNSSLNFECLQLHSLLGSINAVHNKYKLKPYSPPIDLSIGNISHNYFNITDCGDLSSIKIAVKAIPDVQTLKEETSEIKNVLLNESDIPNKIENVSESYKKLLVKNVKDKKVNKDLENIRATVKDHINVLKGIQEEDNRSEKLIRSAIKMFENLKKEEISFNEFKSIFYSLGIFLDEGVLNKLESANGRIDKSTFIDIVKMLSVTSYDSVQLKTAFRIVSKGEDEIDIRSMSTHEEDFKNITYHNSGKTKVNVEKLFDDYMNC